MVALQVTAAHVGGLKVDQCAGDAEAGAAGSIGDEVELPPPAGVALVGDADAFDLVRRNGGEVDIQECTLGDAGLEIVVENGAEIVGDRGEVGVFVMAVQREGDGGNPVVGPFNGGADGARVGRCRRGVGAVVDAGNYEIRNDPILFQDPHAHLHAIHRRAGETEEAVVGVIDKLLKVKVLEQTERRGLAGLGGGGGDDRQVAVGT